MTSFRFIHAADLHLGSPLTGLATKDKRLAERFAAAVRDAFSALIEAALAQKIDFMVIAGDVYDGAWRDNHVGLFFNREIARLSRAGIPVYFLRGNHDAESIVTRTIAMPEGVHEFSTRKAETFLIEDLKVALHGQGFAERQAGDNLAVSYPAAVPGYFNIGVLHTSLSGRPPHADYAPCSPADLASRGYDYWALGHVHSFEVISDDPPIIYPGNIQGRNIRESGEKGAVLVTVDDGRVRYERLTLDCARFEAVSVDITPEMTDAAVLAAVEDAVRVYCEAADERPVALRITLEGKTPLTGEIKAARRQWQDDIEAAFQRVHAELWLEKLVIALVEDATEPKPVSSEMMVDMEAIIDALSQSSEARAMLDTLVDEIARKLPGGLAAAENPLGEQPSELLEEAHALLRERLDMSE